MEAASTANYCSDKIHDFYTAMEVLYWAILSLIDLSLAITTDLVCTIVSAVMLLYTCPPMAKETMINIELAF